VGAGRARRRGARAEGPVRVGASEDSAGAWPPHVLRTFRDRHPHTSIGLKVGITASLLREQMLGRLDVVFGKQCRQVDAPGEHLLAQQRRGDPDLQLDRRVRVGASGDFAGAPRSRARTSRPMSTIVRA
ncbi:LysR substrate-binding domain-containing protein, partial [Burkholderia cenocepacia]|uniref:LysR substrate-binding domain-containing protein n=1 Tax=Burkholderia cenocepacia TaxID=95486 RepID=UPI00406C2ECB